MHAIPGGHPDDRTLESYLLGSLPPEEVRHIEEHLLTCHDCVESAERVEAYIQAVRAALDNEKRKSPFVIKAKHG
ncbi:MAG TPA: zf-HC2 domain-containing protein [Bryobacteraceae bacterium]|jgi:anti-sigma factor RsiW|nr:zf-HC2 domain-containing protein [Bryobacteraceae bacterium]HXJ42881.1 zf-HC2 domain-containing protein [Bryobacteraceae bacterium]